MEEKYLFKFLVELLSADESYSWSNDTKIVLCRKGLWKYVERMEGSSDSVTLEYTGQEYVTTYVSMSEAEAKMIDSTLAYVLKSINATCKVCL